MAGNNIDFELLLKDEKFIAAMTKATTQVKKLNKTLKKTQKTSKDSFKTKNALKFGAALVGVNTAALAARKTIQVLSRAVVDSIKNFAKFEKGMLSVRTLLDETSFAGKSASEGFLQMGKDMSKVLQSIPIEANNATQALFDITSAQISAADATGVLTAAGKLAVAGNTSVAITTKAVVKSLVAYDIAASEATNVAAKFFTAQKLGLTTVEELSSGIGLVAAQASQMGISLDEVLASVVGTTRGALGTRRAFVGLSAAFKNIIKPGQEAQKTAKKFGIELSEAGVAAAGGFIPFLTDLNDKIGGSTKALSTIFASARSLKQVSSLLTASGIKGSADALRELNDTTKNAKTLTDNYKIAVEGLDSQWKIFTNNVDEAAKVLINRFAPAMKEALKEGTALSRGIGFLFEVDPGEIQNLENLIKVRKKLNASFITASASGNAAKAAAAQIVLADVTERILALQAKGVKVVGKITDEDRRRLALLTEISNREKDVNSESKKALATKKKLAGIAKVAADQAILDSEAAFAAFDKQNEEHLKSFDKRKAASSKFAQQQIDSAILVGLSEEGAITRTFQLKSQKLADDVNAGILATDKMLEAQLALNKTYLDKLDGIKDKDRKKQADKDKASLDAFLSAAASGFSALRSGQVAQGGVSSAASGVETAKSAVKAARAGKDQKALTKALEELKTSNEALLEAEKSRDQEAKGAIIGGVSAGVGAAFGPAAGGLAGPLLEILTGSKEDAKAFIEAVVEQVPMMVEAIADNAPTIATALAKAMPQVAVALAMAFANPQTIGQIVVGMATGFRDGIIEAMKGLSFTEGFINFIAEFDKAMRVILTPVIAVMDFVQQVLGAINSLIDNITSAIDAASGGKIGGAVSKAGADIKGFVGAATGGIVRGSGNRDTVPAALTPGELVIDRTTGPRLNKFLDSAGASGSPTEASGGSENQILARILAEVLKPVQVTAQVDIEGDALGEIILNLDRRSVRTTA